MWPIKRKKKSSRKELKQVYYYIHDYITLKAFSKEQKKSLTQTAHDMLMVYVGYQQGTLMSKIDTLQLERDAVVYELKKIMNELKLYKKQFGKIPESDSKQT